MHVIYNFCWLVLSSCLYSKFRSLSTEKDEHRDEKGTTYRLAKNGFRMQSTPVHLILLKIVNVHIIWRMREALPPRSPHVFLGLGVSTGVNWPVSAVSVYHGASSSPIPCINMNSQHKQSLSKDPLSLKFVSQLVTLVIIQLFLKCC
jgi:hypothetical protein